MRVEFFATTGKKAAPCFAWNCPPFWLHYRHEKHNSAAPAPCKSPPEIFLPASLFGNSESAKTSASRARVSLANSPHGAFMQAIVTEKLTRRFGELTAVDSIDLEVAAGQFFGFLGPNGAGKSTTIKMLTGLLTPTSGRMQLLGIDFSQNPIEVKRQIGVVPEGMGLFERLNGGEYLTFVGRMYGLDKATTKQRSEELLEFMQLADRPKTMIADYSHGMQKKLALAAAVIHGPRILFLDEPFEGVDALAAGALKALLGRMTERGVTIF